MKPGVKKGLFVTFEGGEGAGKTTLIEKIFQKLHSEGASLLKTREPGGTRLGDQIREIVLHHKGESISPYAELSLFLASRAQHICEIIQPALQKGQIVLCDRFNDSSIAYQGAARKLGMKDVAAMCSFISQHLEPDLTFYLDIPAKVGLTRAKRRQGHDRIESETIDFHETIRKAYLTLHRENPQRIHLLNAELSPDEVFHQALTILKAHHV